MSTKTLRKRIALVAVSALGAGLLSVVAVPTANASAGDITAIAGNGVLGTLTTGASTTQTATLLTTGSLNITTDAAGYFVVSAGAYITATDLAATTISADQKKWTASGAGYMTVVPTGAAGSTFTVTGYTTSTSGVVTDIVTVSIAGTSEYGVASASTSKLAWVASDGAQATSDVANANKTTYTNGLFLSINLKDAYGNKITSGTGALVATVTDGATVAIGTVSGSGASSTGDAVGTAGTYTQAVSNLNPSDINLLIKEKTAGTGWNGTVTVTYNGVVIGTKSAKITGAPAKLEVAPIKINRPNSTANTTWIYYVKDSAGNELATANADDIKLTSSSDKSVISAAVSNSVTDPTLDADTYGTGTTTCLKAGSSKVVMQITTNGNVVKSAEFTQLCGGAAYSYSASLDKASYVQGEIATMTVTFKDALGNLATSLVAVDTCSGTPSASPVTDAVISAPMLSRVGSTSLFEYNATTSTCGIKPGKAGTKVYTFTVGTATGLTEGSYNAVVSFPTTDVATSVAYKVTTGSTGVSNADVLKAIVSLIASINKQIAALQKALLKK